MCGENETLGVLSFNVLSFDVLYFRRLLLRSFGSEPYFRPRYCI
jgi:hypothetical protein